MADTYDSIFQILTGKRIVDSHVRSLAVSRIKSYFKEVLDSHGISIPEEDIEELSYDIIEELCIEEYSQNHIN